MVEFTSTEQTTQAMRPVASVACYLCPPAAPTMIHGPARATYAGHAVCSECAFALRVTRSPLFWEAR